MMRRRDAMLLALAALACGRAARAQVPIDGSAIPQRWHPGDPPPTAAGVTIGDSLAHVLEVLGPPEPNPLPDDPADDEQSLRYRGGALMVLVSKTSGVSRVLLNSAEAGDIAGFRVGDHLGKLLLAWGEPTSSTSKIGRWQIGDWTVSVKADLGTQTVLRMLLARTPPPPPDTPVAAAPPSN